MNTHHNCSAIAVKCKLSSIFICLIIFFITSPIHAEDIWEINGFVGLTTNYVYRGLSYTGDRINPRASLYLGHRSGLFLNTWFSRSDIAGLRGASQRRDSEFEFNLGYNWQVNEQWSLTLSHAWLEYHRIHQLREHDYREVRLNINYQDRLNFFAGYTDSVWNTNSKLATVSLTARQAISFDILLEAELGWQDYDFDPDTDFPYLRVSAGKALTQNISAGLEFHYSDTKADRIFNSSRTGDHWAAVLSYHFY